MSGHDHGPLTETARNAFYAAKWISPMQWIGRWYPKYFRSRGELNPAEVADPGFVASRARAIDYYVIACLLVEFALVAFVCLGPRPLWISVSLVIVASLRIAEILQTTVNAVLFDEISGRSDALVASTARMVVLAGVNFIELLLCFGVIYASDFESLHGGVSPALAYYVSVVTQLSLGYSDVYPQGWLRVVAASQVLLSFVFIVLVFGRFIASLRQITGVLDKK